MRLLTLLAACLLLFMGTGTSHAQHVYFGGGVEQITHPTTERLAGQVNSMVEVPLGTESLQATMQLDLRRDNLAAEAAPSIRFGSAGYLPVSDRLMVRASATAGWMDLPDLYADGVGTTYQVEAGPAIEFLPETDLLVQATYDWRSVGAPDPIRAWGARVGVQRNW